MDGLLAPPIDETALQVCGGHALNPDPFHLRSIDQRNYQLWQYAFSRGPSENLSRAVQVMHLHPNHSLL